MGALPRLAVLAGPTASGKTELALTLAERLGAELVSADSQQVYRGFNLGTAKPSAAELARVPHHLVSCVDPGAEGRMDAAQFAARATLAIEAIHARGRPVLVVGGTGLYLRALIFGVVEGPGRDEAFRRALEARAEVEGRAALHAELAARDPESAARITSNNLVRIVRALELLHLTGRTASALRAEHGFAHPRFDLRGLLLDLPRALLYRRIEARTRTLFDAGLLDEIAGLVAAGLEEAPPMGSIGYAQGLQVLRGQLEREAAIAEVARVTRHYAKRQLTWFRREPWLRPLPGPLDPPAIDALTAELGAFLGQP